jgi:hypothetical protein
MKKKIPFIKSATVCDSIRRNNSVGTSEGRRGGGGKMTTAEISAMVSWLARKTDALEFGEVVVRIVKHEGRIVRIDKSVTERHQIQAD